MSTHLRIMETEFQSRITPLVSHIQKGVGQSTVTMMPVQPSEESFEEMTVEIDVNTIKGSPLDHDSVPSMGTDDDSQQSMSMPPVGNAVVIKEDNENEVTFSVMTPCEVDSNYSDDGTVKDSDGIPLLIRKPKPGKPVFICEVCNKTFEKRSRLVSHMLTHSNEKSHICSICNKGFKNKSQLQRHSNTHSEVPRFCCNICGRGFKHNDVAKHIRRFHSGPRKSARGGVANPHVNSSQFNTLQTQHHHGQTEPQQPGQPTRLEPPHVQHQQQQEIVNVQEVQQEEVRQMEHNEHEQQLHQEHLHQQVLKEEVTHIESQDTISNSDTLGQSTSNFLFPCTKCNKSFTKRSGLGSHMMVHQRSESSNDDDNPTPKAKHQCEICLKTFTRASGLNGHILLHSRTEKRREPNPDFRCLLCGKMFTRRTGLNAHVLQHEGVLRFWCDEPDCGKGFVHSYQMTRHKRSHSDVLPYTCNVCGKSFRHNDLSKHMRIHTGVKPFNCQHCGKAFAFSSSLRTHERMHLAVREHICEICNTGFTTAAGLRRHVKSHEEEKDETCAFCGKEFSSMLYLSLHMQESQHCAQQQQHQQQQQHHQHQPHQELQNQVQHTQHVPQQVQVQQVQIQHIQPQQQVQVQQITPEQHVQQLSQVHEVHIEVPAHPHPVALTVAAGVHPNDRHELLPDNEQGATLATLTAPNPTHVQVRLPVATHSSGTEQATISSSANVGTLPVLVPFSVSVPISVPFGINLNGTTSEQLHLNHFLSWEQKF